LLAFSRGTTSGEGVIVMSRGDVETFHRDGKWHNRIEGEGADSLGGHEMRDEAVAAGRLLAHARQVAHIIKNRGGKIPAQRVPG
jgi:Uncharacterized protein conserved in bacteria (DUF2188)